MLHSRKEIEETEERGLAAHAARAGRSHGRVHDEPQHARRPEFQRDRDRIIHSRAFRRLEYKTQVFVNGTADHYRTRLTHTIEVAAVARTMARALRANEDLAEAISLAHDLGHSPFGHSGEQALNALLRGHGGFDHNLQCVRAVEYLEDRYPDFAGLNLTWEVRAGLYKHQASIPDFRIDGRPIGPHQYVEAQIADVADDVTYHAHDVDDGVEAGLIRDEDLSTLEIWRRAKERAHQDFPHLSADHEMAMSIRCLLDLQVDDVLQTSATLLQRHAPASPDEVMACPVRLVYYSPHMEGMLRPLHQFLFERVYWNPAVAGANREAVNMMRSLFLFYVENPAMMGRKAQARMARDGLWRAACDYVAGMTDRYALEEYERFGLGKT